MSVPGPDSAGPSDLPALPEASPQAYGPYLLLDKIGSGGMAEVFRAARPGPEGFLRMFALKRIVPRHAESPEFVQMFCNEARLSALLNHPNLVQVFEFGEQAGSYYLVMEYLKGRTALSVMKSLNARQRPFPAAAAAYVGRQVALGLAYAHALKDPQGAPLELVHRDINPSNIMLLNSGGVKLLDFGIAKAPSLATHATRAGLVKGKLSYASPEQLKSESLGGRSDVFSLGVSLWEMLTTKKLFGSSADFDTVTNVMNKTVRPPSSLRPDIPPELDCIILEMLERDPGRRPDARTVAARLGVCVREAGFMEEGMSELMRELYGAHTSQVVTVLPSGVPTLASEPTPESIPVDPPTQAEGATRLEMVARARRLVALARRRPAPVLALTGAAVLSLLAVVSLTRRPPPAPWVAAERSGVVTVELESRPSGATVRTPDGAVVGQTPVALHLPWSRASAAFVLDKDGFAPTRFEVVPERDSMATLDLRQIAPP